MRILTSQLSHKLFKTSVKSIISGNVEIFWLETYKGNIDITHLKHSGVLLQDIIGT